jgi:hypothetical protein
VVAIDYLLKGNSAQSVALLLMPSPEPPIASNTIFYEVGQQGLWFLRSKTGTDGLYLVDHPQRFSPMDDTAEHVAELKKRLAGTI